MPSRSRFALASGLALATATLAWSPEARAAEPRPIVVAVDGSSDVAADDVRRAVGAELGATIAGPGDTAPASAGRLDVTSRGGVLRVTFHDARGRTITREVTAPQGGADRVRLIALLAGNLARNEAEELAPSRAKSAEGEGDGADDKGVTVRAAPGEIVRVEVDARSVPTSPGAAPPPAPSPAAPEVAPAPAPRLAWSETPTSHRGSGQRTAGWITLGGGLAVGGAGVAVALAAKETNAQLSASCAPSCTVGQVDAVRTRMVVADLLLGIGTIGTVTGVVLLLTAPSAKVPVAVDVGGRSIGIVGAF